MSLKARRTQTNNAQLNLAEPYSNKDQVAYSTTWGSAVFYNFDFKACAHA